MSVLDHCGAGKMHQQVRSPCLQIRTSIGPSLQKINFVCRLGPAGPSLQKTVRVCRLGPFANSVQHIPVHTSRYSCTFLFLKLQLELHVPSFRDTRQPGLSSEPLASSTKVETSRKRNIPGTTARAPAWAPWPGAGCRHAPSRRRNAEERRTKRERFGSPRKADRL